MKIVIFEPHPDDLLFGVGHVIFDWIEEGHDISIITVTDGRACYREMKDSLTHEAKTMTEDEVAKMRLNEAKEAVEFLGNPKEKHFLLEFHDAEGPKYVNDAIEKVKPMIKDAEVIVLPSDNNAHKDHQATHDIAVKAAQELSLQNTKFWIYFIPSYGKFKDDSKSKQREIEISEDLQEKLLDWLKIYQSQKKLKFTWKMYNRFLRVVNTRKLGEFDYQDIGKYYNF
jgi:LmbE family N-acetylglucosaminyl deacetylase